MRWHWDIHSTLFAASGSTTAVAVVEYLRNVSWASAASVILSGSLALWQFYLLRKREWTSAEIDNKDRLAEAEARREARRRAAAREQDRLDALQAIELERRRHPAAEGHGA